MIWLTRLSGASIRRANPIGVTPHLNSPKSRPFGHSPQLTSHSPSIPIQSSSFQSAKSAVQTTPHPRQHPRPPIPKNPTNPINPNSDNPPQPKITPSQLFELRQRKILPRNCRYSGKFVLISPSNQTPNPTKTTITQPTHADIYPISQTTTRMAPQNTPTVNLPGQRQVAAILPELAERAASFQTRFTPPPDAPDTPRTGPRT